MIDMLVNAMIAAIIGTVAFVVARSIINSQNTTTWTALERSVMDLVPAAVAIVLLIGVFLGVTKIRTV